MQRIISLLLLLSALGCPVSYRAHVLNQTEVAIVLRTPCDQYAMTIPPGQERVFPWSQPYIVLEDSGDIRRYQTFPVDDRGVDIRLASVHLNAIYRDRQLLIKFADEELSFVPIADSTYADDSALCPGTPHNQRMQTDEP